MKKLLIIIISNCLFFILSSSSVSATTVSLPAIADNYVDTRTLNGPGGSDIESTIYINNYPSVDFPGTFFELRGLIKFDLSGIPDNAIINSARLRIYSVYIELVHSVNVSIWRNTTDWSENLVSWSNQPPVVDLGLSSPIIAQANHLVSSYTPWDVTDVVKKWKNGTYPNYGFKIIGERLNTRYYVEFRSRHTQEQNQKPEILVDYSLPINININSNLFRTLGPTHTPTPTSTLTPTPSAIADQQPTVTPTPTMVSSQISSTPGPTVSYYDNYQGNYAATPTVIPEVQISTNPILTPIPGTSLFAGIQIRRLTIAIIMVCSIIILLILGLYALSKWNIKSQKAINEKPSENNSHNNA